jgi:hypothetical protein
MKYIKHFEELKWGTYLNASRKLRKISPQKNKQRADDLIDHADRMELKRVRQELSGVMTPVSIRIVDTEGSSNTGSKKEGVGRFYAVPYPEYEMLEENIEDGSVREIPFILVITPVDEEAEKICREVMPDGEDFSLSGIGALWLSIELKLEEGTYELGRIKVVNMDQYVYGNCELQGRAAYGTIKNTLQKMFTDKYCEFYQEFEERIIAGMGLSSDHGLSMDKIANHLKSLSVNTGFMAD